MRGPSSSAAGSPPVESLAVIGGALSAGSGANGAGHNANEVLGRSMTHVVALLVEGHIDSLASTSACVASPRAAAAGSARAARRLARRAEARRHLEEHLVLARRHAGTGTLIVSSASLCVHSKRSIRAGDRDAAAWRARGGHEHAPRRHHVRVPPTQPPPARSRSGSSSARALELRLERGDHRLPLLQLQVRRCSAASRCLSASGRAHLALRQPRRLGAPLCRRIPFPAARHEARCPSRGTAPRAPPEPPSRECARRTLLRARARDVKRGARSWHAELALDVTSEATRSLRGRRAARDRSSRLGGTARI